MHFKSTDLSSPQGCCGESYAFVFFPFNSASPPKRSRATLCGCTPNLCSSICPRLTSVCLIMSSASPAQWWQWVMDPSTTCSLAPFRWRSPASRWPNAWPTSSGGSEACHCSEAAGRGQIDESQHCGGCLWRSVGTF